jgi:vacuole morphology and inheritance protein 14
MISQVYARRKLAALECEQLTQTLASQGDVEHILSLTDLLTLVAQSSSNSNARKGGLLCLAAVAVGLAGAGNALAQDPDFVSRVTPAMFAACTDADGRMRYYALEALYNVAKSTRPAILAVFADIFEVLFRLAGDQDGSVRNAGEFLTDFLQQVVAEAPTEGGENERAVQAVLTSLSECMEVDSSPQRSFLLGWVSFVDGLPYAEHALLTALPDLLPGMLNCLEDGDVDVRRTASRLLDQLQGDVASDPKRSDAARLAAVLARKIEVCSAAWAAEVDSSDIVGFAVEEIALSGNRSAVSRAVQWLQVLVSTAPMAVAKHAPEVLRASLRCLDAAEPDLQGLAAALSDDLLGSLAVWDGSEVDMAGLLNAASEAAASAHQEVAKLEALRWMTRLLSRCPPAAAADLESRLSTLCELLSATSDRVVQETASALSALSAASNIDGGRDDGPKRALVAVLSCFRGVAGAQLLQRRGAAIIEQFCKELGSERTLRTLCELLSEEQDRDFARALAASLILMLLTSARLHSARSLLASSPSNPQGASFFRSLFKGFRRSVVAALTLSLLCQAYDFAAALVAELASPPLLEHIGATIVELAQCVSLLEAPVFAFLRLQLLEPERHPALMVTLRRILMLLPQGDSFSLLQRRLSAAMVGSNAKGKLNSSRTSFKEGKDSFGAASSGDLLKAFVSTQSATDEG